MRKRKSVNPDDAKVLAWFKAHEEPKVEAK